MATPTGKRTRPKTVQPNKKWSLSNSSMPVATSVATSKTKRRSRSVVAKGCLLWHIFYSYILLPINKKTHMNIKGQRQHTISYSTAVDAFRAEIDRYKFSPAYWCRRRNIDRPWRRGWRSTGRASSGVLNLHNKGILSRGESLNISFFSVVLQIFCM